MSGTESMAGPSGRELFGESESESEGQSSSEATSLSQPLGDGRKRSREGKNLNEDCLRIASRVHGCLCMDEMQPLPVKAHRSAVNSLLKLRNLLVKNREEVQQDVRMLLLFCGISVQRRLHLGAEGDEGDDLKVTLGLLFMLQVLCDREARAWSPMPLGTTSPSLLQNPLPEQATGAGSSMDVDPPAPGNQGSSDQARAEDVTSAPTRVNHSPSQTDLEHWNNICLWDRMRKPKQPDVDTEAEVGTEVEAEDSWGEALRPTPDRMCRVCIDEAVRMEDKGTFPQVIQFAAIFFRCSTLLLQYNMLLQSGSGQPEEDRSFLTLGSLDFNMFMTGANTDLREQNLAAIADAAESEAGQQVRFYSLRTLTYPNPTCAHTDHFFPTLSLHRSCGI